MSLSRSNSREELLASDQEAVTEEQTAEPVVHIMSAFERSYRDATDEQRERMHNEMRRVDNELLIQRYNDMDEDDRSQLLASLKESKKQVIFNHYLNELQEAFWELNGVQPEAFAITAKIILQLDEIKESKLQADAFTRVSDDDFLRTIHATTNFIKTPALNNDMQPNPAFNQRADELTEASNKLRSSARWRIGAALIDTLIAASCIAACIMLSLYTFGVIAGASALTLKLGSLGIACEAYVGLKNTFKAIPEYYSAHRMFSVSNKMNALGKAMQQPPVVAESAETREESLRTSPGNK